VHIGPYTLSGVIHAKIEAMALEDINLSCIELKRHDPLKILDQHCLLVGVKRYVHEESPHDNIFRRAMSYQEVLQRIQGLPKHALDGFLNFQKARRSFLPSILQQEYTEQSPRTQPKTQFTVSQTDKSIEKLSQMLNPSQQQMESQPNQKIVEVILEVLSEEILKENIIQ
jgi:hypothetical protein